LNRPPVNLKLTIGASIRHLKLTIRPREVALRYS
jgi:hypothetical protein